MIKRSLPKTHKALALSRMALEIPTATATVLAKRLPMLAAGALDAKKRNRPEEQRMVAEKVAAGLEAGRGIGEAWVAGSLAVAGAWWQAIGAAAPTAFGKRPRTGRKAAGAWQNVAARALDAAVATTEAALRPAHRKVTANARRLAKRKP